jgi:hypothetical protein
MAVEHKLDGAIAAEATKIRAEGDSETGGTIDTPSGPISWTRHADGSVTAEGGGQQLTATGTESSDGSWQRRSVFSRVGQQPYLTIECALDNPSRSVARRWKLVSPVTRAAQYCAGICNRKVHHSWRC